MKKQLLMVITTSLVIAGTGTVFAEEAFDNSIKFDGNITVHYRSQHDENPGNRDRTGLKSTITLNTTVPLTKSLEAYARFTYQNLNNNHGTFSADYFNNTDQDNSALDAFGLKYKNAGYTYILGSQALTFGGGLVYDNPYIGKYALPYAINIGKKVGVVNMNVIAAETNYQNNLNHDKLYVLQGSYNVNTQTTIGTMLAHAAYGKDTVNAYTLPDSTVNFISIYGSNKLSSKATLSAEYLTASASADNQAFQTNLRYKLDTKNTMAVGYYYVEDQAVMVDYNGTGMSAYPASNAQGYSVAWTYQFDKNTSMKIANFDYKKLDEVKHSGAGTDRNRFTTTVSMKF